MIISVREITNIDPYEDIIKKQIDRNDISNYLKDNRRNIPLVIKKVRGLMKDDLNGSKLISFRRFPVKEGIKRTKV